MTQLNCKLCKAVILEDINFLDETQQYVQCPACGRITENPFYEK